MSEQQSGYETWPEKEELTTEIFPCPDCSAEFNTEDDLSTHRRQVHYASTPGIFRCPACEEEFPTRELMLEHGRREHPAP